MNFNINDVKKYAVDEFNSVVNDFKENKGKAANIAIAVGAGVVVGAIVVQKLPLIAGSIVGSFVGGAIFTILEKRKGRDVEIKLGGLRND